VKHVQLATGQSLPCELVIVAIGSEPCTDFCQQSSLEMTNGGYIRVNERLETSIEHVLAVGDISQYPLKVFNLEEVNCQHWQMACSTGHQAGEDAFFLFPSIGFSN
jgi:3-phenylpropionate/trans-cinnamate dioxygenase ferredoxin reductase component